MNRDEVLGTAQKIINGPRHDSYGEVADSFRMIAQGWSELLGAPVTPRDVARMMVWLKLCRDTNSGADDNLVDICGYAALAAEL